MDNIRNLLNEVNTKIKALETAKELYGEQLAPDFSVFDFINTNETGISWILANLLNPKSTHGQKTLFLEKFIKICLPNIDNHEDKRWQNYLTNLSNTTVITEQTTTASQTNRRMDIYLSAKISDETFGICIENKPYAGDQPDQLTDYYNELKNRNLTCKHLVYLSEYGEPSDYSVKAELLDIWRNEKIFSHVTYTQLVEWLTECKKDCQNQSVTEFINQFIKFIQKQFMGMEDMSEENAIVESLMQDRDNLKSAMKIANALPELKNRLIFELEQQIKSKIQNKPYTLSYLNLGSQSYAGFGIVFPDTGIEFCFEFQSKDFNTLCVGYTPLNRQVAKGNSRFDKVAEKIRETLAYKKIKTSTAWLGWYYYEYCDWGKDAEVWLKIKDGTLSDEIVDEIDLLQKNLTNNQIKL